MSDEFIAKNPKAAVQFLVALTRSWGFSATDPDRVMRWYNEEIRLDYEPAALMAAVGVDPNLRAKTLHDINLELDESSLAVLEKNAAWGEDAWENPSLIRQHVNQDLLARAMQEIENTDFKDLKVILPSVGAAKSIRSGDSYGLDSIPLILVFAFMILVALFSMEFGLRLGRRAWDAKLQESERPISTVAAAVLGMMAFVIALTFGSATARFDARKTALLDDVTAIETAYLQTSMLPEPHRTTVRSLLRDYVQARVGIVYAYGNPETLELVEERAKTLQHLMWSQVEILAEAPDTTGSHRTFASALTEVFKLHTKRVVLGAYYRIPGFLWWAILFASAVAMVAVGFQFGIVGGRRIYPVKIALALTFALVMMLAFDLDRAGEGLISVNQEPMINLYRSLRLR